MSRILMPLLLIAAVGFPIWHVLSPKPWEETELSNIIANASANQLPPTQYMTPPISVYSQAAFSNPASSSLPNTIPNARSSSSSFPQSNGLSPQAFEFAGQGQPLVAPVVSNKAFQSMSGKTLIFAGDANGPNLSAPPMEFVPTINLAEIFRFDVGPSWVKQRWPRVSTSPRELELRGLRVDCVTGTNTTDLAGVLTYYFDAEHRVRRITLRAWTGDATRLLSLLSDKFGFRAEKTRLAGLYLSKKRGLVTGGLVLKHPAVISSDNPAQQIWVALEINNPKEHVGISQGFQSVVLEATNSQ